MSTKQNEDKIVPLLGCLLKAEGLQHGYQMTFPWRFVLWLLGVTSGIMLESQSFHFWFFFSFSFITFIRYICMLSWEDRSHEFWSFPWRKVFWGFSQEHCNAKCATIQVNRNNFSEWVYQLFSCSYLLACVLLGKNFRFSCTPEEPCDNYSEEFVSV